MTPVPPTCPSQETLAAYIESGRAADRSCLSEEELDRVEEHLVGCAKCREVVADVLRRSAATAPLQDRQGQ